MGFGSFGVFGSLFCVLELILRFGSLLEFRRSWEFILCFGSLFCVFWEFLTFARYNFARNENASPQQALFIFVRCNSAYVAAVFFFILPISFNYRPTKWAVFFVPYAVKHVAYSANFVPSAIKPVAYLN